MTESRKKVVLLYSGGLDSTVLLYDLASRDMDVMPLGIMYQQSHRREIGHAHDLCRRLKIGYRYTYALFPCMEKDYPLFGGRIPECHYEDDAMRAVVVPNRNMVFLSLAISYAVAQKADSVAYACHAGDSAIFPDCRPEFVQAMDVASRLCDDKEVSIVSPFASMSKADIVQLGSDLGVPFELTWTCYKGQEKHCGKCGACVERMESFKLAGVSDPTEYGVELKVL